LYAVENRSRVWAVTSKARIKRNLEDLWDDSAFTAEAEAVVGALARDSMIN